MADMHVMTGDGERWNVIMHFAVPNVDNEGGVNYRTALVNSGLGGSTAMPKGDGPGQISTVESEQITVGELYEYSVMLPVDGTGQSTDGRRAMLRVQYATLKAAMIAVLRAQLKFFGHTESEV